MSRNTTEWRGKSPLHSGWPRKAVIYHKKLIFRTLFLSRKHSQIIMRISNSKYYIVSSYQFRLLMISVSIILIMHVFLFSHNHCILSTYLNHHKLITTKQTTRPLSKFIFYPNSCFFSVYLNKIQYINVTCLEYDPFMYPSRLIMVYFVYISIMIVDKGCIGEIWT